MYILLSIIYVLICLFLIFVVLLQQGRGGGMGGAFGGSSQTVFGGAGAGNVLTRATSLSAGLFMVLSATLAWMSSSHDADLEDVLRDVESRNRGALLEAAESSASDDEPGATEAPDEAVVPPVEDDVEGAEDEALEPPGELPFELGSEPVEPGLPSLGDGPSLPTLGGPSLGGGDLRLGGDEPAEEAADEDAEEEAPAAEEAPAEEPPAPEAPAPN